MGRAKEAMLELEENLILASRYLVDKGLLDECEIHEGVFFGGGWDLEDEFWRNAMADRNRNDSGPIPWAAELEAREFTDLLKQAYESHCNDDCCLCEKNIND